MQQQEITVNALGGSGDPTRDSWNTPRWLADLIGSVTLDPCSNGRSHVQAMVSLSLENGDDGLSEKWAATMALRACARASVFLNPGYSRGEVIKWVQHYRETRFIYLLRWAPDTKWFAALHPRCSHVWHPDRRIDFEPPPGVKASSNPHPHALYLREPSQDLLDRLDTAGYIHMVR